MTLSDYQQEIGGVVLGTGTAYTVAKVDGLGMTGVRTQDAPLEWDDGEIAGVDRLEGREIIWEGGVSMPGDPGGALDAIGALQDVFDDEQVRTTPNAVVPLRLKLPGRPVRVVYGRPRRLDYDDSLLVVGWLPFTAAFRALDPRYYSEAAQVLTLGLNISQTNGIEAPVVAPIVTTNLTDLQRPGFLTNEGSARTWPVVRFSGPCTNPSLTNVGTGASLGLSMTIPDGEYVEIDTRPWSRTVLRNGTASASGSLMRGSRISEFYIEPGTTEFSFAAVDATNTSRARITAYPAWRSL